MAAEAELGVMDIGLRERAQKRMEKKKRRLKEAEAGPLHPGVVYVGHIPHGFYEEQMRKYFSQFGTVTRLKLARSRKTGRSRGYAFIEFECDAVAKIVAETMNNYVMYDKLLKCQFVGVGRVRKRGGRVKEMAIGHRRRWAQKLHNKPRTTEQHQRRVSRLLARERRKRAKLKELGMKYDFPGYAASTRVHEVERPTHTVFEFTDSPPTHRSDSE